MANPKLVSNYQVFVNGTGQIGKTKSVKWPDVEPETQSVRGGGMITPVNYVTGIKQPTTEIVWYECNADALSSVLDHGNPVQFQIRCNAESPNANEPVSVVGFGTVMKVGSNAFEAGSPQESTTTIEWSTCTMIYPGGRQLSYDRDNNKFDNGKKDIFADMKSNIGA